MYWAYLFGLYVCFAVNVEQTSRQNGHVQFLCNSIAGWSDLAVRLCQESATKLQPSISLLPILCGSILLLFHGPWLGRPVAGGQARNCSQYINWQPPARQNLTQCRWLRVCAGGGAHFAINLHTLGGANTWNTTPVWTRAWRGEGQKITWFTVPHFAKIIKQSSMVGGENYTKNWTFIEAKLWRNQHKYNSPFYAGRVWTWISAVND